MILPCQILLIGINHSQSCRVVECFNVIADGYDEGDDEKQVIFWKLITNQMVIWEIAKYVGLNKVNFPFKYFHVNYFKNRFLHLGCSSEALIKV